MKPILVLNQQENQKQIKALRAELHNSNREKELLQKEIENEKIKQKELENKLNLQKETKEQQLVLMVEREKTNEMQNN